MAQGKYDKRLGEYRDTDTNSNDLRYLTLDQSTPQTIDTGDNTLQISEITGSIGGEDFTAPILFGTGSLAETPFNVIGVANRFGIYDYEDNGGVDLAFLSNDLSNVYTLSASFDFGIIYTDTKFAVLNDLIINTGDSSNPYFYHCGEIGGSAKYVSYQVEDTNDYYELNRQDSNVVGFKVNMPLNVVTSPADVYVAGIYVIKAGILSKVSSTEDSFSGANDESAITLGMNMDFTKSGDVDNYGTGCSDGVLAHRFLATNDTVYKKASTTVSSAVGGVYGGIIDGSDVNATDATLNSIGLGFFSDCLFDGKSTLGTHNHDNILLTGILESQSHTVSTGTVRNIVLYAYKNHPWFGNMFLPKEGDENYVILDETAYPWAKRADNSKITLGAGDDYSIFFDGDYLNLYQEVASDGVKIGTANSNIAIGEVDLTGLGYGYIPVLSPASSVLPNFLVCVASGISQQSPTGVNSVSYRLNTADSLTEGCSIEYTPATDMLWLDSSVQIYDTDDLTRVTNFIIGDSDITTNPYSRLYGYLTATDDAKYTQFQIDDTDDYLHLTRSAADVLGLKVDMPLTSGNLTIGSGVADTDYTLTFDGETNDGSITWMEDEDYFQLDKDLYITKARPHYALADTGTSYCYADFFTNGTTNNFRFGIESSTGEGFIGGSDPYEGMIMNVGIYPIGFWTNGVRRIKIGGDGNIEIGDTTTYTADILNVRKDITATDYATYILSDFESTFTCDYADAGFVGINAYFDTAAGSATASSVVGAWVNMNNSTGVTVAEIDGLNFSTYNYGTATSMYGGKFDTGQVSGNTVDDVYGVYTSAYVNLNSVITDYYSVYLSDPTKQIGINGTVTNNYGLYIPDRSVGGTLNYSIYTNAGLVRFGDNAHITTNADTYFETEYLEIDLTGILADLYLTVPILNGTAHSTLPLSLPFPYATGVYDRFGIFDKSDRDEVEILFAKTDFSDSGALGANLDVGYFYVNWDFCPYEDANYSLGHSDLQWVDGWFSGAITATSFVIGENTLSTDEWAYLDGQDQAVKTTSTPTFASTLFTDKIKFTQTDGNEYIDSLNDGYVDIGATTGVRLNNKIASYNNIATEGYGVPAIVDVVQLTGQQAAIGSTNLTNTDVAGIYRVTFYLRTVDPEAGAPTVTLHFAWNDGVGGAGAQTAPLGLVGSSVRNMTGDGTNANERQPLIIVSGGSVSISYYTVLGMGTIINSSYNLYIVAERLN